MTFTSRELADLIRALYLAGRWHDSELDGLDASADSDDGKRAKRLRAQQRRWVRLSRRIEKDY